MNSNAQRIAALIDHTILRADATEQDVRRICAEARQYSFAAVCVNGYWVPLVASELAGSTVKVCTVAGFPLGAMSTEAKLSETEIAIRAGAHEVDMVINVGALKSGERDSVQREIASLAAACHEGGAILKVILETALLTDELKRIACRIGEGGGRRFREDINRLQYCGRERERRDADARRCRDGNGREGIRRHSHPAGFENMVAAGASRIGASASVSIIQSVE